MQNQPIPYVAGQDEIWCQLCPFGQYAGVLNTTRVMQHCDRQAFDALVAGFVPEVLVDTEHNSETSGDTCASAWVQELRVDNTDGLMARLKLTDVGAADLQHRRRRFLSPAWTLDASGRPDKLLSVAMTNKPNIRMRPVLNTESPAATAGQPQERNPAMDLKTIALALGLPETATAEEVLAAVKGVQEMKSRIAELEKSQLGAEADAVCNTHKDRIGDLVKFRELYVANKDFALQALDAMPKPTVCNRAAGQRPEAATSGVVANKDAERRTAIEAIRTERRCSFVDAEAAAQARHPELFA
ncbi:MAG: phage protease [Kiritimatiellia bacterium]